MKLREVHRLSDEQRFCFAADFHPQGEMIVLIDDLCGEDGQPCVRGWSLPSMEWLDDLGIKATYPIESLKWHPDGELIALGGKRSEQEDTITLFSTKKHKKVATFTYTSTEEPTFLCDMRFSQDGSQLISAHDGGALIVWDVENKKKAYQREPDNTEQIAPHCSGGSWTCLGQLSELRVLDNTLEDVHIVFGYEDQEDTYAQVQCADEQTLLLFAMFDPMLRWVSIEDGSVKKELFLEDAKGFQWMMELASLSPDQSLLAAISEEGELGLWELESGKKIFSQVLETQEEPCFVRFSPDGTKLLSYGFDTRLWEIESSNE